MESHIENDILCHLTNRGFSVDKIVSEGFYDTNKNIFRKRTSRFARPGISDIVGTIPPMGRALYIEVKEPSEMKKFDQPVAVLEQELLDATYHKHLSKSSLKKYQHALDQARFIEQKLMHGAVAFYASSVEEVDRKLKEFGV